ATQWPLCWRSSTAASSELAKGVPIGVAVNRYPQSFALNPFVQASADARYDSAWTSDGSNPLTPILAALRTRFNQSYVASILTRSTPEVLDLLLRTPRRTTPRTKLAPGSMKPSSSYVPTPSLLTLLRSPVAARVGTC